MAQDPRALLQKVGLSYPPITPTCSILTFKEPQLTTNPTGGQGITRRKWRLQSLRRTNRKVRKCSRSVHASRERLPDAKARYTLSTLSIRAPYPGQTPLTTLSQHRQRGGSSVRACRRHSNQEPQRARRCRQHPHRSLQILPKIRP